MSKPIRTFKPRTAKGAERVTQLLGDLAGAVVQVVDDDQNGWDCMLEFPPIDGEGLPADLAPPGLTVLVQVKSLQTRGTTVRISLANALKYARHPLPAFLVLVKTDGDLATPPIYVKHVWTPLLHDILKAVRQAEVAGKPLHKASISIKFDETERYDAKAVEHIAHVVDGMGANYATQKEAVVGAAGYEDGAGFGSLTFDGIEIETLVDLMLGIVEGVDVAQFTFSEARFGIRSPKPTVEEASGKISVDPQPASDCNVIFRRTGSSNEVELPGQLFVPGLPGLPREFWKIRVKTEVIDFVMTPTKAGSFSSTVDTTASLGLEAIYQASSFWAWAGEGELSLEIWARGHLVVSAQVTVSDDRALMPWARLRPALEVLVSLASPGRRPRGMTFQLHSLFNKLELLHEFRAVVTDDRISTTWPDIGFEADFHPARLVMPVHLELDGYVFFAFLDRPVRTVTREPEKVVLALGPPTLLKGAVREGMAEDHRAYIADMVRALPEAAEKNVMSYVPVVDERK